MYWYNPMMPSWAAPPYSMPVRQLPLAPPVPRIEQVQPYLTTWPYSNIYYGNYYDS
ncbi:hypothetical protein [Ectobacillus ponti]|uniref:Uncharacterized protein n=1 Tax=Ectobacillus ponti TaxID=2961894 RepID=A0AA42BR29_9BACI|nr:hypothetical protein [Ectobacillus ponti]MCP8966988.1 hypothetical protein [Ectobacillus ponti]